MGQAVMKDLELLRACHQARPRSKPHFAFDHKPKSDGPVSAREIERFFTADSDPSQERRHEARQARALSRSPPGTGKSQRSSTWSPIDRMGKSLLVVCQKQAALEVVRKRLEKERLGNRFMMITDVNRDRGQS